MVAIKSSRTCKCEECEDEYSLEEYDSFRAIHEKSKEIDRRALCSNNSRISSLALAK